MPVADCERLVEGWLAQPANAVSSLAFVLVGLLVPMLGRLRSGAPGLIAGAMGASLVLVGIGSVAFHGPGGPVSDWIHDGTITMLLVLVVFLELGRWVEWTEGRIVAAWLVVSAAALTMELVQPTLGDILNAPLAFLAILGIAGPLVGSPRLGHPPAPGGCWLLSAS